MATISTERARGIAADWHGGQTSALYAFCSTGRITDHDMRAVVHEVEREVDDYNAAHHTAPVSTLAELMRLLRYLLAEARTRNLDV